MVPLNKEQHCIAGMLATEVQKVCSVLRIRTILEIVFILSLYLLLRHKSLSRNTNPSLHICVVSAMLSRGRVNRKHAY